MKTKIKNIFLLSLMTLMIGCLDIQDSYDYEPSNANPYLEMTTWEFIVQRQDTFSILKSAIEYVDTAYPGFKNLYTQTDKKYTYLLLNDAGFTATGGVFKNSGVTSVQAMNPEKLRDILLYHIVEGAYHSLNTEGSLNFEPINVITLLKSQNAVMTMCISNANSRTDYSRLKINQNLGSSTVVTAATSNLMPTNGVIHVFSQQIIYKP